MSLENSIELLLQWPQIVAVTAVLLTGFVVWLWTRPSDDDF